MSKETLETEIFGKQINFEYSQRGIGYSIIGLRVLMAWIFIQAGLDKIIDEFFGDGWSSTSFLEGAIEEANPFFEIFQFFAQHPEIIDPMVMYGQVVIGLALLLGIFFRLFAFLGGLQMLLFWVAAFEAGFLVGLPVEHGYLVNSELVYIFLLYGLGAMGAGRILGLDEKLEKHELVDEYPKLRYLLG